MCLPEAHTITRSQVVDYVLYLSDEGIGEERSQAGNPVLVDANETLLAEDTNLTNFTYLQVYARSVLAEQTTPAQFLISDAASTVQGLDFIDKDLDAGELGGIVTWQTLGLMSSAFCGVFLQFVKRTPVDTSQLVHYRVFLPASQIKLKPYPEAAPEQYNGLDNTGNRSQIGVDLPPNVQTATVAADQPAASTAAAVFAKSSLFEQTIPASVEISDIESVATDLQFEDLDLDTDQLLVLSVAAYSLYFAAADLSGRQAVHSDVPGTAELTATTSDNIDRAAVSNISFVDKAAATMSLHVITSTQWLVEDLDVGELGGTLTWASEGDDFAVQDYLVYVVQNAGRSLVGTSPVGSNQPLAIDHNFSLPPTQEMLRDEETVSALREHYTSGVSGSIHSSQPSNLIFSTYVPRFEMLQQVHNISDTDASVSNVQFLDEDLDKFELAGPVVWTEPADAAQVYFATSAVGTGRSQLGQDVPAGTNTAYVPDNFQSLSVSHILLQLALYTRSYLAEQTTPVALEFIDDAIEVENITFTDEDLDPSELGGQVAWEPPNFTATVTHFIVYLTTDVLGTNRTKVGSEIPLGTNVALVPAETLLLDWKYIAVYMKSPGELGGTISWTPPDETLITDYDAPASDVGRKVYLSPGPTADNLGALVNTSAAGTTEVFLSADTPLLNFSYVLVYARFVPIPEANFTDHDLDAEQVGGDLEWAAVGDVELVSGYNLYLSESATSSPYFGKGRKTEGRKGQKGDEGSIAWRGPEGRKYRAADPYPTRKPSPRSDLVSSRQMGDHSVRRLCLMVLVGSLASDAARSVTFPADIPRIAAGTKAPRDDLELSPLMALQCTVRVAAGVAVWSGVMWEGHYTVRKDLDELELGGTVEWQGTNRSLIGTEEARPGGSLSSILAADARLDEANQCMFYSGIRVSYCRVKEQPLDDFSFVLLYTKSVLAEQTTPHAGVLNDTVSSVSNISFWDKDLDEGELGGRIYWLPPEERSQVTHYAVYLAEEGGDGRSLAGTSAVTGPDDLDLPAEEPLGLRRVLLVFASSSLVEQTTPQVFNFSDTTSSVSAVSFTDVDLDALEIGGDVFWDPPNETSQVDGYSLYLNGATVNRSVVGVPAALGQDPGGSPLTGTNTLPVPTETVLPPYTSLLVYTFSSLTEQSSPAELDISDTSSTVTNVLLVDKDLDEEELGGEITWTEPSDTAQIRFYATYMEGPTVNRSQIGAFVPVGISSLGDLNTSLDPDTLLENYTEITVYTRDTFAVARTLSFEDDDLDGLEIAGDLIWQPPANLDQVAYLANNSFGAWRSRIGILDIPVGTNQQILLEDTAWEPYLLVYTKSSLAEQTTPAFLPASHSKHGSVRPKIRMNDTPGGVAGTFAETPAHLRLAVPSVPERKHAVDKSVLFLSMDCLDRDGGDSSSSVPNVTFVDKDLDAGEMGGTIIWAEPADSERLAAYTVYRSFGSDGVLGKSRLYNDVAKGGANTVPVMPDMQIGVFWYIAASALASELSFPDFPLQVSRVYSRSSLYEQTTPVVIEINDTVAKVNISSFTDRDLDENDLGGVVHYRFYLAEDVEGAVRTELLPPETIKENSTHLLVYTVSTLAEQTASCSQDALPIYDMIASVSQVTFIDQDTDFGQLGGEVTWFAPDDVSRHVVVYTRSSLVEQTTPAFLEAVGLDTMLVRNRWMSRVRRLLFFRACLHLKSYDIDQSPLQISDTISSVPYLRFTDLDLDPLQIGGYLEWVAPEDVWVGIQQGVSIRESDNSTITHYTLYAAEDALGSNRHNFELENYTHLLIYTKTDVSEQTVPTSHLITDEVASVSRLMLVDLDLDESESPPTSVTLVAGYYVYLAESMEGSGRSPVGAFVAAVPSTWPSWYAASSFVEQTTPVAFGLSDSASQVLEVNFTDLDLDLGELGGEVHQIDLPSDQPYASSSLAEQTTPLALAFNDTDSSVSSINFTDRDLDADEIGGTISWTEPADPALVANYVVYIAEDQFGGNRSQVGSEVPWNSFGISLLPEQPIREPDGAARSEYSQVYTKSTLAEQSTPISFAIVDVNASVSGGAFQEQDLDEAELGGPITWKAPADLAQVTHYDVYFVEFPDATGTNRSQLGDSVEVGTNIIHVPADFLQGALSHIQVYTRSSLVEQSTPHVFVINNTNASVSSIEFLDDDLDDKELGGNVTWLPPDDMAQATPKHAYLAHLLHLAVAFLSCSVSRFVSYLASDAFGGSRSQIANQPFDTEEAFVQPVDLGRAEHTGKSAHKYPSSSDTFATVRNADFLDQDLDYDDLGGTIQWNPPADNIRTTDYVLYLSVGADGTGRQKVGQELVGTNKLLLLPGQLGFVTVFTRSVLLEQTTPVRASAAVAISDTIASVSGVDFLDLDLDEVVYYKLYFSVADPFAAGQHVNGTQDWLKIPNGSVDVSLAEVDLATDFALSGESHVLIYTQSALASQAPSKFDKKGATGNVSFTDLDLDDDELGGNDEELFLSSYSQLDTSRPVEVEVTWLDPPPEQRPDLVDFVDVYLSEDTQGAGRSQIQAGQASADTIELAAETALRSFRHILVFTRSSLAEQSTPVAFPISDTGRYVASLSFTDQDLDREEFGGNLSWQQPVVAGIMLRTSEDASLVAHYVAYLATTPVGSDRAHVAELEAVVAVKSLKDHVRADVNSLNYAPDLFSEQTTPVAVNISDTVASVSSVEFVDQDLDIDDLGGDVAWAEPVSDIEYVHFYDVYLANSSAGAFRSQLGRPIPQGLAQTRVPVDLTKGLFSDIVVYTRSVLVEQTTPVGVEISDTSSDVQNVTFTDLDLDLGDVGGHVYWETPLESSQVAAYRVYLAFDETGSSRSQIGAEVFVNSSLRVALLEPDHTTGSYKQITVYSKSDLAEQTTPVAFQLQDTESVVTDTNFTDLDLDGAELGGTIFWSPAGDTHLVVAYDLYLSESASGESLSRINESLPVGTHDLFVPPELPLGKSTHIVVFTRSSLVEQTTPAFINISDADWNVPEVSFFDMDLDGGDFGGQ
ncbi:PIF1, partial [Symbiodinium sp. KB8]